MMELISHSLTRNPRRIVAGSITLQNYLFKKRIVLNFIQLAEKYKASE
jgi:hypothetical protein